MDLDNIGHMVAEYSLLRRKRRTWTSVRVRQYWRNLTVVSNRSVLNLKFLANWFSPNITKYYVTLELRLSS